jgi:hypothetical protein
MLWVIFGHVAIEPLDKSTVSNIFTLNQLVSDPKYSIVYGAFYSVDAFFWMGGVL